MERIMGLDVGDKTIGIAISDPLLLTAQGLKTIIRQGYKKDINELKDIIDEYNINKIVIGIPKNMNNTIGFQGEKVIEFTNKIREKIDAEIVFQDERLTTVSADRTLIEANVRRNRRKELIDKVAATYILQNYLNGMQSGWENE